MVAGTMSELVESTQKPAQSRSEEMAQEDSVTTIQYIAVNLNGAEKVKESCKRKAVYKSLVALQCVVNWLGIHFRF